jgi:Ca2+/Na+ antiporter
MLENFLKDICRFFLLVFLFGMVICLILSISAQSYILMGILILVLIAGIYHYIKYFTKQKTLDKND